MLPDSASEISQRTNELKQEAKRLGFALAGVCPAHTPPEVFARLQTWLAAGYAGQMHYLQDRLPAYADPGLVLAGAKSVLMLALPYRTADREPATGGEGNIARYAWGEVDYHDLIHERLKQLTRWFTARWPLAHARGVVDSAPLMERDFAQLAGLGWIGKNTLLLNRELGSWFFLAAMLVDVELAYDLPFPADHCGTCTACLDACPTQAFPQPYVLDATRCISYLTIELRDEIPSSLRSLLGDWVFGCDVCQDVCPWNRRPPASAEPQFQPQAAFNPLDLIALFQFSDDAFRRLFRSTPMWRTKRNGLLRNAAIVLGNQRCQAALPVLQEAAASSDPLVSEACAWAIEQMVED